MMVEKIDPASDYPECKYCKVKGTDKCPALWRVTKNCPYYPVD